MDIYTKDNGTREKNKAKENKSGMMDKFISVNIKMT